jgi:ankyrin repeat protein
MDTRLHPTTRPKEELWLIDALEDRDIQGAQAVIQIIKDKALTADSISVPSLASLDDDGNSFLSLSIINQLKPITQLLYEWLKDNDDIIFGKNKKNQTLLWHAAYNEDKEILEILLPQIITRYKKKLLTEKFWFLRDANGNTPLHAAITLGKKCESLSYLLNTLQKIEDKKEIIVQLNNLTNKNGNTPLHIAAKMKNIQAIALLTKYGADWMVLNDMKKNIFDYFCEYNIESQQMLMALLPIDHQHYVLNLYQANLLNTIPTKENKENYIKLASLVSLKSLIIANSIINIPIRMAIMANPANKAYFTHDDKIEIEIETEGDVVIVIDEHNNNKSASSQNDRAIKLQLTDFTDELDAYILFLQNHTRSSYWRPASIIFGILIWLTFWGVEIWMIDEFVLSEDLTNCNKTVPNRPISCADANHPANIINQQTTSFQLMMFSVLGMMFSIIFSILLIPVFQQERQIPKKEWKKKLTFLDDILLNLKNSNHNLPLDHNESIEQLQTAHDKLKRRRHPCKKEIIETFTRISETSKKIRTNFNLGFYNNNLTLFTQKKPSLLNILNIDEEKIPLLRTQGIK